MMPPMPGYAMHPMGYGMHPYLNPAAAQMMQYSQAQMSGVSQPSAGDDNSGSLKRKGPDQIANPSKKAKTGQQHAQNVYEQPMQPYFDPQAYYASFYPHMMAPPPPGMAQPQQQVQ